MKSQKILWIFFMVVGLVSLNGCGSSPVTEPVVPETHEKLTMTVGNVTVDSESNISRVTLEFNEDIQKIFDISTNHEATIVITGKRKDAFSIVDHNAGKELRFVYPAAVGVYEIEIVARDDYNQTAIYPLKINIMVSLAKKLIGKTLYLLEEKTDRYRTFHFTKDTLQVTTYDMNDTKQLDEEQSILYHGEYIDMVIDGRSSECHVYLYPKYHGYELFCRYDAASQKIFSFTDDKILVKKRPETVHATDVNNSITTLPSIDEFNLTTNRYVNDDNQSEIDAFVRDGEGQTSIRLSQKLDENQTAYLFFHKNKAGNIGGTSIHERTINLIEINGLEQIDFHFKNVLSGKFDFKLAGASQSIFYNVKSSFSDNGFGDFPSTGFLNVYVCRAGEDLDSNSCNFASIPVKLY